jgi:hypothetical protein
MCVVVIAFERRSSVMAAAVSRTAIAKLAVCVRSLVHSLTAMTLCTHALAHCTRTLHQWRDVQASATISVEWLAVRSVQREGAAAMLVVFHVSMM